jgi:phosphoglucosamine mutase
MARLFGTDGIRGKVGTYPLTPEMIYKIGRSAAVYIKNLNPLNRKRQRISIAKDTRGSGDMFEEELVKGITSKGVDVLKLGILPTPSAAFLVPKLNCDLGIMISASHNSLDDNGVKFFTHKGYKILPGQEEEIEKIIFAEQDSTPAMVQPEMAEPPCCGKVKDEKDAASVYINSLKEILKDHDISKYKIALDCAFGAASYLIPHISRELNINISSINDTPDGNNINKECGSLSPSVISGYTVKEKCDCGFAFDGDGDRVIACDHRGEVLDGDFIMAIIGSYLHSKNLLNRNTIITTMMSNLGLEMSVNQWGGRLVKTEVGDKFVLDKMLKGKFNLGGEQSGHIILLDYSPSGDGLLTAIFLLKIMSEENKTLQELSRCMYKFPQVLLNVEVSQKRPFEELPKLSKAISKCETKLGSKGRLYIRYSGTEDKLRIMIEGHNQLQIRELAEELAQVAREELQCQSSA